MKIIISVFMILGFAQAASAGEPGSVDGPWFLCEYAHSKIPPSDQCRMMDDDGFLLKEGTVHHIKVTNSAETNCRGGRAGHCFLRTAPAVSASRSEIGPVEISGPLIAVDFFGCVQLYGFQQRDGYIEIRPAKEQCFWTPNKHYYLARYEGRLTLTDDD